MFVILAYSKPVQERSIQMDISLHVRTDSLLCWRMEHQGWHLSQSENVSRLFVFSPVAQSHCSEPWSQCDWGCEDAGALATDGSSSPYINCEPAASVSTTGRLGSKHSENLISTQDERPPRFFSERELLHIHGEQHSLVIRKLTCCCSPRHHLHMKHL